MHNRVMDVSTDLTLGLSISPTDSLSSPLFTPPSSSFVSPRSFDGATIFVKVYLEGVPIGRKLNLSAYKDYDCLIQTLSRMFSTTILWPDIDSARSDNNKYVLTYEDKESDWMLVGDVPWEMFLTNVKKLKITRADKR